MRWLAHVLLLLGVLRHFTWEHFEQAALVWNISGAAVICALLYLLWRQHRGLVVGLVACWFAYEEALVMVCSTWRIFDWWPVAKGEAQCSAGFDLNFQAISLVAIGALIAKVSSDHADRS